MRQSIIPNTARAHELYYQLVRLAKQEILLLFPTINAFTRQVEIVKEALLCAVEQKNVTVLSSNGRTKQIRIKIRILMPSPTNEPAHQKLEVIKERFPTYLEIRHIESLMQPTQATILIVDRIKSLVMEIKDDTKMNFDEAIGLSTFSSSRAGVLSYVSIFNNLWKQIELYEDIKKSNERLKIHDRMQREFINVAAHELRTPIQPILGLSQILLSKTGSIDQYTEFLDVINRNAKRLNRLTDDILDATKIESKMLDLKREQFNINDIITNAIDDITLGNDAVNSGNVQLIYQPQDIVLKADKGRITQVVSNLLTNAVKFTQKGSITISTKKDKQDNQAIINVKDTGSGIDPEILPELFSKFTTRSFSGTGLGLFISKSIIEAHGGKIWAENNKDGKGTSFTFSLPLPEAISE